MKLKGTNFQIEVWKEIIKIPKGSIKTYKEIAIIIGKPHASRAVANACGKNPYIPLIPCHRVIRSDGNLGGYSGEGGMNMKKQLLFDEGYYNLKKWLYITFYLVAINIEWLFEFWLKCKLWTIV